MLSVHPSRLFSSVDHLCVDQKVKVILSNKVFAVSWLASTCACRVGALPAYQLTC